MFNNKSLMVLCEWELRAMGIVVKLRDLQPPG